MRRPSVDLNSIAGAGHPPVAELQHWPGLAGTGFARHFSRARRRLSPSAASSLLNVQCAKALGATRVLSPLRGGHRLTIGKLRPWVHTLGVIGFQGPLIHRLRSAPIV